MVAPASLAEDWWDQLPNPDGAALYGTRYWESPTDTPIQYEPRGDDSKFIMDKLLDFVRAQVQSQTRFLAFGWFHAPHLPVVSGPPWTDG